jgi:hypothetical protein
MPRLVSLHRRGPTFGKLIKFGVGPCAQPAMRPAESFWRRQWMCSRHAVVGIVPSSRPSNWDHRSRLGTDRPLPMERVEDVFWLMYVASVCLVCRWSVDMARMMICMRSVASTRRVFVDDRRPLDPANREFTPVDPGQQCCEWGSFEHNNQLNVWLQLLARQYDVMNSEEMVSQSVVSMIW